MHYIQYVVLIKLTKVKTFFGWTVKSVLRPVEPHDLIILPIILSSGLVPGFEFSPCNLDFKIWLKPALAPCFLL